MVLYFSGTGNSYYIAKKIATALEEELISIAELVYSENYTLRIKPDESIGFVYPVHACAPADIVTNFIKKATFISDEEHYLYSVFNCAGSPEYTSRIFKETCQKKGLEVKGFYNVLMPGNYITRKKHLPKEKVEQYLSKADENIEAIITSIKNRECNEKKEKHSFLLSYVLHKLSVLEKTEHFIFGEECIQCGKCMDICPMHAITREKDGMERDEKKCAFCLGCVNVCPTHALQVGKKTQGHPQYIHPFYDGKASAKAATEIKP